MKKTLSTTLTFLAVLALAAFIFLAGSMYARMNVFGPGNMMFGSRWNDSNTYGPNMMNGGGPSMMGNGRNMTLAPGAHRPGGSVPGSAGVNGYRYNNSNITPLTIDQAKDAAEKYLSNLNNSDLRIAEIMIFDNNAYVVVKEASTGIGAFELLVDPVSQIAYPEHGPNMMWNLKYSGINHQYMMDGNGYGMMSGYGGMMQGWNSTTPLDVNAVMIIKPEQAIEYAQQYLEANISGATAASDPIQFYGYYTLDFEKDSKVAGMLSVNGYSGQVLLHTWHGTFIEESE